MVFSSLKKLFFRNKESSDDLSELRGAISQYQGEEIEEEKEMLESVLDLAKTLLKKSSAILMTNMTLKA